MRRLPKIPRKIKKAAKHINKIVTPKSERITKISDNTYRLNTSIKFEIQKGYPNTRYARKAIRLLRKELIQMMLRRKADMLDMFHSKHPEFPPVFNKDNASLGIEKPEIVLKSLSEKFNKGEL